MLPRLRAYVISPPSGLEAGVCVFQDDTLLHRVEIDCETLEDFGWEGHDQSADDQADALLLASLDVLEKEWLLPPEGHQSLLEYDTVPIDGHLALHVVTTVAHEDDPVWN